MVFISNIVKEISGVFKIIAIVLATFYVLFSFLSSETFIEYLSRKIASSSRKISTVLKDYGMEKAIVESKISFGILSFKVIAEDKKL